MTNDELDKLADRIIANLEHILNMPDYACRHHSASYAYKLIRDLADEAKVDSFTVEKLDFCRPDNEVLQFELKCPDCGANRLKEPCKGDQHKCWSTGNTEPYLQTR